MIIDFYTKTEIRKYIETEILKKMQLLFKEVDELRLRINELENTK